MQSLSKAQLSQRIRTHVAGQLYDESGVPSEGIAIYGLSDPRALREVRYIGQTSNPRRRFLQHLQTARLWIPEQTPWWVKSPELRPLYEWIRLLYRDVGRLPTMIVETWVVTTLDARRAERARICTALVQQVPVLNVEARLAGPQLLLL